MEESKFTPGPWEFIKTNAGNFGANLRRGYLVLTGQRKNAEADAHLIATAPELYEACRWTLYHLDDKTLTMEDLAYVMDEALAKARGESK